jgi:hypothetical protein
MTTPNNTTTLHTAPAIAAPVLFRCPYCARPVREHMRLSYPAAAVGAYQPVYRCVCGRHFGLPIMQNEA